MPLRPHGNTLGAFGGEPLAHHVDVALVRVVVDGIRLGHPHDVAGLDLGRVGDQTELVQLARALGDELVVGAVPHPFALVQEVLQTEAGPAVLDHERRPRTEVLDPPDLDVGIVDVDPVVAERELLRDDERDREVVAIPQVDGGGARRIVDRRFHRVAQRADRHRRDDVRARIDVLVPVGVDRDDFGGTAGAVADRGDAPVELDLRAGGR